MNCIIDYPELKIYQRSSYSKPTADGLFADIIDVNKALYDFNVCNEKCDEIFDICNSKITVNDGKVKELDIKYLFLPNETVLESNFSRKNYLTSSFVFLPKTLEKINTNLFANAHIPALYIPENIKMIEDEIFENSAIEKVIYDANVNYVPKNCFKSDLALNLIVLNDRIETIHALAFANCLNLKNITLPSNLYYIGQSAFYGTQLESISFPQNLHTIDPLAFAYTKLKEVEIPKSVTSIGSHAFLSYTLEKVIINNINLELGTEVFYTKENLNVVIRENDKEKANAWIKKYKNAFSKDTTFILEEKEETLEEKIINNSKRVCGYVGSGNLSKSNVER